MTVVEASDMEQVMVCSALSCTDNQGKDDIMCCPQIS